MGERYRGVGRLLINGAEIGSVVYDFAISAERGSRSGHGAIKARDDEMVVSMFSGDNLAILVLEDGRRVDVELSPSRHGFHVVGIRTSGIIPDSGPAPAGS